MESSEKVTKMQAVIDQVIDHKKVFGTSFAVKKDSLVWYGNSGNFTPNQAYFIASTTKLFTTAIILRLKTDGRLNLDDKISNYLDDSIVSELHMYKGVDYSNVLTIKHLLAHTSGLPDYFQGKSTNGTSLEHDLQRGNDQFWSFEQALQRAKAMKPHFAPGTKNKALYSDTNFQLLGKIIEAITDLSFAENCAQLIIEPLDLVHTYLYCNAADSTPKTLFYKANELHIPLAMTAFGADGAMVSTSSDMLIFIEAFFTGKLFPKSDLDDLQVWNNIFFPLESGIGLHRFKLPWFFNPTGAIPVFIGHSGLSGALAFFSPKENLYIVGTVNQVAHPDISFKTMIKLAQVATKKQQIARTTKR